MSPEYEKRREYYRQRYAKNRDALLAQSRRYQREHPEVVRRARRRYYAKNSALLLQKRRARYAENPAKDYATHRLWVEKNESARRNYMRVWRSEQFEHRKAYDAIYAASHRTQRAEHQNSRRARQIGNGGSHTKEQWLLLQQAYNHQCGYCRAAGVRLTKDHAIPLARYGTDDIDNIIPACLPCNRRKHVKTAEEFMAVLGVDIDAINFKLGAVKSGVSPR